MIQAHHVTGQTATRSGSEPNHFRCAPHSTLRRSAACVHAHAHTTHPLTNSLTHSLMAVPFVYFAPPR